MIPCTLPEYFVNVNANSDNNECTVNLQCDNIEKVISYLLSISFGFGAINLESNISVSNITIGGDGGGTVGGSNVQLLELKSNSTTDVVSVWGTNTYTTLPVFSVCYVLLFVVLLFE
jgi:hypothetical protein